MLRLNIMKLTKGQKILGAVATSLIEKKDGKCPTDEEFALYMEGGLNKEERKTIISHFVSCRECRERFTIPAYPLGVAKEAKTGEGFLSFLWRPFVLVPVAVVFLALLTITLDVYMKTQGLHGERYEQRYTSRSANLVTLKQVDLTPGLLTTIRGDDEEGLKNELIKELPTGAEVTHIFVEDKLKDLKETRKGDKITLVLYSNGLLKVKLKE